MNELLKDLPKKDKVHRTEWVKYLEDELVKSRYILFFLPLFLMSSWAANVNSPYNLYFFGINVRKEILLQQSECKEWEKRANFARERFQSMQKEFEHKVYN